MNKLGLALVVASLGSALYGCGSSSSQTSKDGGGAGALGGGAGSSGVAGSAGGAGAPAGGTGGGGIGVAGKGGAAAGAAGTTDGGAGNGGAAGSDGGAAGNSQAGAGGAADGGGLAGAGGQGGAAGGTAGSAGSDAGAEAGAAGGASGSAGSSGVPVNGLVARYFDASSTKLAERIEQMPASKTVQDHIMMAPFAMSANVTSITWDGWIDTSRFQNLSSIGFGLGGARFTITVDDTMTITGPVAILPFTGTGGWHKLHLGALPSLGVASFNFFSAQPILYFKPMPSTSSIPNPDELSPTQPF